MNNNQRELWFTIFKWLKQCGSNPNKNFCRTEITSHPDYPSLVSATDFVDSGGMEYSAVRADVSYIHDFNYPLLAHIRQPGNEYLHIVSSLDVWNQDKEITQHWSGIVIYPEKNSSWHNAENENSRHNSYKSKLIALILSIMGAIGYLIVAYHTHNIAFSFFGLLSLTGVIISLFALSVEAGLQNQIAKKVCGSADDGGCEQVLKSKYAKIIPGVSIADFALAYFLTQLTFYALNVWYNGAMSLILYFGLTGIFIGGASVYLQAYNLRKWCAICLGIVAVLLLQTTISLTEIVSKNTFLVSGVKLNLFIFFSIVFVFFLSILLPIKQILEANRTMRIKIAELKRWKLDINLFLNHWNTEASVDVSLRQNDLLLGKPWAPLTITVACNPYCKPCAKMHSQLEEMLRRFDGKIKVLIRFICYPYDLTNKITVAVSTILQKIVTTKSEAERIAFFTDWFSWMEYEKWVQKWKPDLSIDVSKELNFHHEWTIQNNIAYTPTIFLSGKKVPGRYSLEDLALLIPQLVQSVETEAESNLV